MKKFILLFILCFCANYVYADSYPAAVINTRPAATSNTTTQIMPPGLNVVRYSSTGYVRNIQNLTPAYPAYYMRGAHPAQPAVVAVANGDYFTTQVNANHILLGKKSDALILRQQIIDGKITFEEAAKKYSLCPSREEGGNLGYFSRGAMVPQFENAAFDLPVGQISQPVETRFGWHLIQVIDKK